MTLKLILFLEINVLNILAFVIGIWIVYLHIIIQKSLFCKHSILFINLIKFVSMKHIWILHFQLTELILKIRACMPYSKRRARTPNEKGTIMIFTSHFSKFKAIKMPQALNSMFLEVLAANKVPYFSERAWLK